ncbi:MAG: polysaccharide deacetylase family protein [Acidobacteriia bacterium]|nr:polysaccharide deacetylase family protein [Terriglobia bacterium]
MRTSPLVSVIIPTHQRPQALARVLEGLRCQTFPASDLEVVVVLDGPCRETQALLESGAFPFALRWFVEPARGAPAARNLGVAQARGEVLLFLDDDIIPVPELIDLHLRARDREGVVVFGGFKPAPNSPERFVQETVDWSHVHYERCSAPGYNPTHSDLPDGNMSATKGDLIRAGLWDETFSGVGGDDDRELALRLLKHGIALKFDKQAIGYHYYAKSWSDLLYDQRHIGCAHQYYMTLHPRLVREYELLRALAGTWWGRAAFRAIECIPEVFFQASMGSVRRWGKGLNPKFGKAILRFLVRRSKTLFYIRGLTDTPRTADLLFRQSRIRVPILGYHHVVRDATGDPELMMDLAHFERQMRTLVFLGFKTVSLRDLCGWLDGRVTLPPKPVVLTFDDGYEGFLPIVAPVLERYNLTATIFLIAGKVGREIQWNGQPPLRIMSADEAAKLARMGFDIQSHGLTHLDSRQIDAATLRSELLESKRLIEQVTGKPVRFFAYPHGRWSREVRDAVEQAGFAAACTSRRGRNGFNQDRHLLNRSFILRDCEPWRLVRELYR